MNETLPHDKYNIGDASPSIEAKDCSVTFDDNDPQTMLGSGVIVLHIKGKVREAVSIAHQMCWLVATCRESQEDMFCFSDFGMKAIGDNAFEIRALDLETVSDPAISCWLPLFNGGILAYGFPVPWRQFGEKGIELPFSVLMILAKIMYPVEHQDGIYLKSFSSLVFPTAITSDFRSIQWHMDSPGKFGNYLAPGTFPSVNDEGPWVKINDLNHLISAKRNFLGFARLIEVHVGTDSEIAKESIRRTWASGAPDENPGTRFEISKIQTGTSGLGFWGIQAEADIIYPKALYQVADRGWYVDMLDTAKQLPLIVYDHSPESRRAYLLPTLSVILHMAHLWGRDKSDVGPLPFAEVQWDAGEAAYHAIKEHSKDVLRDSLEEDKPYRVKDLISRLLISLEKVREVEIRARSDSRRTVSLETSKFIYGWDLQGIAQGQPLVWRQQLQVDQDWRILGTDLIVLFCQNVGELVKPSPRVRLCVKADIAHHKRDQLIAPVKCLRNLSDRRGMPAESTCLRLGNQIFWQCQGDHLFDDCVDCLRVAPSNCKKQMQQINRKDTSSGEGPFPPIEGAIVFGKLNNKRIHLSLQDSSSSSGSQSAQTPETSVSSPIEVSLHDAHVPSTKRKSWRSRIRHILLD